MCMINMPKPKNLVPTTQELPDKAPNEIKVKKDRTTAPRGNPLRIDLASSAPGAARTSGPNI